MRFRVTPFRFSDEDRAKTGHKTAPYGYAFSGFASHQVLVTATANFCWQPE